MTSVLAKYVSKRILGESVANNFGKEDPYFETVPATRLNGSPSSKKTKKVRKALPPGISEHDGKVLTKVKRRAYRLDMSLFNCCGIRVGWSSVIGIIPGVGDVIDAFMAMMVLRTCEQVEGGLPADVRMKMYINIILDFGIGLVPILGDVADMLFRANTKNAVVLENYLRKKGAQNLKSHGQHLPVDPTDPDEYDRHVAESDPPPRYASTQPLRTGTQQQTNRHGEPHEMRTSAPQTKQSGGWLGGFGSKSKQHDVERGDTREQRRKDKPLPRVVDEPPRRQKSTLQKNRP